MKKYILSALILSLNLLYSEGFKGSGTVMGDNNVVISSKAMGFITKINVKEGEEVFKGQELFSVDDNSLKLKLQQAKGMKNTYVADLINVERNLKRHERLFTKDMVSKAEVENLQTAFSKLSNLVKVYDAQILEILDMKKYLNINSPTKGTIAKKNINVGEMYMPGMPALIITDLDNLVVEVDVPENKIKVFRNSIIKVSNENVGYQGFAKLDRILPMVNPMTHSFKAILRIEQNGKIYPGMYINIEIKD